MSKRFGDYSNIRTGGSDWNDGPRIHVERARSLTLEELQRRVYAAGQAALERSRRDGFRPPEEEGDE